MGMIGQHFADSGLTDLWVEAGIYSECTAGMIMQGKSWNRRVRAHKLTSEAFNRLLLEQFRHWQDEEQMDSYTNISQYVVSMWHNITQFHVTF